MSLFLIGFGLGVFVTAFTAVMLIVLTEDVTADDTSIDEHADAGVG